MKAAQEKSYETSPNVLPLDICLGHRVAARLLGLGLIPKQLSQRSCFSREGDATGFESAASVSSAEAVVVVVA